MAGVNFSGVGSGIDFSIIADSIIAQRNRPIQQLQLRQTTLQSRNEELRQLNARLITLTDAARKLTDRELGTRRTATTSASDVVGVSATDEATPAVNNISVTRLASSFAQASRTFTESESVLAGGETSVTLVLRKGGAAANDKTVTINSSNNTLEGLSDAINAAGADVTASVVDVTGAGDLKLVLTSKVTGAINRVELIDPNGSASFANLNLGALNPPGATSDFSQLDAAFTINNLAVTRPTNSVSDVAEGVKLDLKKVGSANVTVSSATSDVADKLKAFVDAYNAVQDFVAKQYVADDKGRPAGVLAGDPTLREVQRRLREALGDDSTTNGGTLKNLAEIGLGRDEKGKITFDRAALDEKLKTSFGDVQALLSGKTALNRGVANNLLDAYEPLGNTVGGLVQNAIAGYDSTIKSLGASISSQQERLEILRASLTRQFAAADAAIGQLNGQGSALTNVLKSLEPRER